MGRSGSLLTFSCIQSPRISSRAHRVAHAVMHWELDKRALKFSSANTAWSKHSCSPARTEDSVAFASEYSASVVRLVAQHFAPQRAWLGRWFSCYYKGYS